MVRIIVIFIYIKETHNTWYLPNFHLHAVKNKTTNKKNCLKFTSLSIHDTEELNDKENNKLIHNTIHFCTFQAGGEGGGNHRLN